MTITRGAIRFPAARAAVRDCRLPPRPAGLQSGWCSRLLFIRGGVIQGDRNTVQIIRKVDMGAFVAAVSIFLAVDRGGRL